MSSLGRHLFTAEMLLAFAALGAVAILVVLTKPECKTRSWWFGRSPVGQAGLTAYLLLGPFVPSVALWWSQVAERHAVQCSNTVERGYVAGSFEDACEHWKASPGTALDGEIQACKKLREVRPNPTTRRKYSRTDSSVECFDALLAARSDFRVKGVGFAIGSARDGLGVAYLSILCVLLVVVSSGEVSKGGLVESLLAPRAARLSFLVVSGALVAFMLGYGELKFEGSRSDIATAVENLSYVAALLSAAILVARSPHWLSYAYAATSAVMCVVMKLSGMGTMRFLAIGMVTIAVVLYEVLLPVSEVQSDALADGSKRDQRT